LFCYVKLRQNIAQSSASNVMPLFDMAEQKIMEEQVFVSGTKRIPEQKLRSNFGIGVETFGTHGL
jgi:hypothetical protein